MNILTNITRAIVGLLFIFSGLVKANDPLGLSYKMQEFFELWNMHQLNEYTLWFSIFIIAFEIIAGVALLIGWQIKLFSWLLLLLIVFFTFLTGYAHFSGKFKNCGCFGDCIPISAQDSFLKDVALLIMILFLSANRNRIKPVFGKTVNTVIMIAATVFSFGIQWYVLRYLPFVDCLPFKRGNNIEQQMKMPANAVPDVYDIRFVYEKDGKRFEFTLDELPADIATYTFVDQKKKLIRRGKNNEPPIKGFSLIGATGIDSTQIVLNQHTTVLLFSEDPSNFNEWVTDFTEVYQTARSLTVNTYFITTRPAEAKQKLKGSPLQDIQVFSLDYTAMRTAARANPSIYILINGEVAGKWSYKEFNKALGFLQSPSQKRLTTPDGVPSGDIPKTDSSQQ